MGELLGALDAETHRLLTKWRGRLDTAERENRRLKEELRLPRRSARPEGALKKQHLAGGSVSLHGQLAAASEAAAASSHSSSRSTCHRHRHRHRSKSSTSSTSNSIST